MALPFFQKYKMKMNITYKKVFETAFTQSIEASNLIHFYNRISFQKDFNENLHQQLESIPNYVHF